MVIVSVILVGVLLVIYFMLPYSGLKSDFRREVENQRSLTQAKQELLTDKSIEHLPEPIKKFYGYIGYINKPQFTEVKMYCQGADFVMDLENNKHSKINYTEQVFSHPARLAFIDTKVGGIPFQGLDTYINGNGGMRGVIAKHIELFNVTGEKMNEAALATWLCEAILIPRAMCNENLQFKQLDDNRVEVELTDKGISVSAIYEFDKEGKLVKAITDNRGITEKDGTLTPTRWTLIFEQYEQTDEYYLPKGIKSMWNKETGDVIYFESHQAAYTFY